MRLKHAAGATETNTISALGSMQRCGSPFEGLQPLIPWAGGGQAGHPSDMRAMDVIATHRMEVAHC